MPEASRDSHASLYRRSFGDSESATTGVEANARTEPKPPPAWRVIAEYLGFIDPPPKPPMCAYPYNPCMMAERADRKLKAMGEFALSVFEVEEAIDLVCSSLGRWLENHDY